MADLTTYLQRVLDAILVICPRITVDEHGDPEPDDVAIIAAALDEDEDDVRRAILGLHGTGILIEDSVEFPGMHPVIWWVVHPAYAAEASGPD